MTPFSSFDRLRRALPPALIALTLGGCALMDKPGTDEPTRPETPAPEAAAPSNPVAAVRLITAQTPAVRAYRKVGAEAIYKKYPKRIYRGRIPPLVYAVVVVETDIDAQGNVTNVTFSRVPSHAPEVPPKIAELVRAASPLPNPGKLGAHTYVDTWLWDKSGNFQLDTLTKGQRSR
ncbi:MAG: hypothetical protein REJ24_09600 [Rhodocyclaceae bacterium]|nr:hypothetical protein [Pseudomonadota bacterium]MDQ7972809.1 hypothetical protein [Rhodocyclaceae bacterium]MDQ7999181.1 hypothetical protein [Pseudomonadota bacterium]MDQ8017120.1 hypothetical protein [Pseudomonadota bacterium]